MNITLTPHGLGYVLNINGYEIYIEGAPNAIEELKKLLKYEN